MKKPMKKDKFGVGQVVAIKWMKGLFKWGQVTKMSPAGIELDDCWNRVFEPGELRPLTAKEIGPRRERDQ